MQQTATRPVSQSGAQSAERSAGPRAWAGVLLGAAGLFILNLVFGPIAIGLGVTALRRGAGVRVARVLAADRVAAVISVVLGVADLAVLAALLLHSASTGTLVWRFGS